MSEENEKISPADIEAAQRAQLAAESVTETEPESETDAVPPKTAAEVEADMIARQAAAAAAESGDEDNSEPTAKPGRKKFRLGIHGLQKTFKGKMMIGGVGLLILAGLLLYNFPNLFRAVFSSDKGQKQETTLNTERERLTDLNSGTAFPAADGGSNESRNDTGDTGNTGKKTDKSGAAPAVPAKPVTFSRSLAVSLSGTPSGGGNSQSRAGTETDPSGTAQNAAGKEGQKGNTAISVLPYDPNLFIPENTVIPCSLDRRFVSDLSGKMTCTVSDDIYSASGNVRLIEKGTRASLVYKAGTLKHGQGRVFIIATKLRTRSQPFLDIPLIDSEAAGALGESGVDGWIDTHFWERFGGAMMLGMIPDAMQGLSGAGKGNKDNNSDYTANSREAFAGIARDAFANSVNIPPTLYKNQGEIITLITGEDLDFSGVYQLRAAQ